MFTKLRSNIGPVAFAGIAGAGLIGTGYLASRRNPMNLSPQARAQIKKHWTDSPEREKYRFNKNVRWQRDAGVPEADAIKFVRANPEFWKA